MTENRSDHKVLIRDLKASKLHALYAVCMRFPFVKRCLQHQALLHSPVIKRVGYTSYFPPLHENACTYLPPD